MSNSTKRLITVMLLCSGANYLYAQWCVPTTAIPYAQSMPGITHVIANTINRTSAACENYPNNSYVLTGLSTTLVKGNTYSISITHTIDATICPDMNLRVWIDYNLNHVFDVATETAVTTDHHLPGTYTANFTVPASAVTGATRMRVTAKMSDLGGHTPPTPCDVPPDPIGYHGEIEDYTVNIISSTGIEEMPSGLNLFIAGTDPLSGNLFVSFDLKAQSNVSLEILNILGKKEFSKENSAKYAPGTYSFSQDDHTLPALNPGVHFVTLTINSQRVTRKVIIL